MPARANKSSCSHGVNEQAAAMPISSVQQAPTEGGMSGLFLPLTFPRYFPSIFPYCLFVY